MICAEDNKDKTKGSSNKRPTLTSMDNLVLCLYIARVDA